MVMILTIACDKSFTYVYVRTPAKKESSQWYIIVNPPKMANLTFYTAVILVTK